MLLSSVRCLLSQIAHSDLPLRGLMPIKRGFRTVRGSISIYSPGKLNPGPVRDNLLKKKPRNSRDGNPREAAPYALGGLPPAPDEAARGLLNKIY